MALYVLIAFLWVCSLVGTWFIARNKTNEENYDKAVQGFKDHVTTSINDATLQINNTIARTANKVS